MVQQCGLPLVSGGKAGGQERARSTNFSTEQVNSGNSALAAVAVSLSPELCQVALVTLHGGRAGTGARSTCPVGWGILVPVDSEGSRGPRVTAEFLVLQPHWTASHHGAPAGLPVPV